MKRKVPLGIALTFVIIAAAVSFAVTAFTLDKKYNNVVGSFSERSLQYEYLAAIDNIVRSNYCGDIDEKALRQAVSSGYASGLNDIGCMYLTEDEYASYKKLMSGFTEGCGIDCRYDSENNCLQIVSVAADSPAMEEGIEEGFIIKSVDGEEVSGENAQALVNKIENSKSGNVTLCVTDSGTEHYISLRLGYTETPISFSIISGTGYIRINAIYAGSAELFRSALDYFGETGISKVIIDLRNNAGYAYEEAASIIDMLVPVASSGNKAIAIVHDKNGEAVKAYDSDADYYQVSAAVLVNDRTSGAAELIAADLGQFGKADIYGEKTSGDGKVVSVFELSGGNALVLPTGIISPYIGDSFDGKGISPDNEIKMSEKDKNSLSSIAGTDGDAVFTAALSALSGK